MAGFPYGKIYLFYLKTPLSLKVKGFLTWLKFSLIHNKILGRYAKTWIFTKIIFCIITFKSYLTTRHVK